MTAWIYLSIDERKVNVNILCYFGHSQTYDWTTLSGSRRGKCGRGLLIAWSNVSSASQNFILQVAPVTTAAWSGHRAPTRRLGVLFAGLGSISTTLIAGVQAIKRGLGRPIGSLALLGSLDTGTPQAPKH